MDAAGLLFAAYVVLESVWLGAGLNQFVVTGATLTQAGPEGVGFARALARRHGTGLYFAALAFLTTIAGLAAYATSGALAALTDAASLSLAAGLLLTLATLARGATLNRVAEAKWLAAAGSGAAPAEVAALAARAHRVNRTTIVLLASSLLFVLLYGAIS